VFGVNVGELGPQEDKLGGIIDPGENNDHGTGCTESGGDAAVAEIESDSKLTKIEQHRRRDGADPDIMPMHACIGYIPEKCRE